MIQFTEKPYALLLVTMSFVSLSGCVSERLNGRITTYHQPDATMIGESYHIVALPDSSQHTAQGFAYQHYAQLIDKQLLTHGMIKADKDNATYQVAMAYTQGTAQTGTRYVPDIGQTGISSTQTYTLSNYSTTSYMPSYGIIGYHAERYHIFPYYFCIYFYQSPFTFAMIKNKTAKLAYEVCAGSIALQSTPERAYPAMIHSIFNHFPAPNASSQPVSGWLAEPAPSNNNQEQTIGAAAGGRWG